MKSCTETHCPWLTGFVFPASGMYGPLGVVLRNWRTWSRSSPFRAAGLPCAPRNPRGSSPVRPGRKSKMPSSALVFVMTFRSGRASGWQAPYGGPVGNRKCTPADSNRLMTDVSFPREVQTGSHRHAQVFHGVLLAPASSVGDDSPGRRRATARRLPERPHACRGCGEDGRVSPRSRTVLAGSPRPGILQYAAKRSSRLSGRRSRRMVSNDEHGRPYRGRGRPACTDASDLVEGCVGRRA